MKRILWTILLLCACAGADTIPPNQVKTLVGQGAVLVDVRSKSEFESGHLAGAIHLPHGQILELEKKVEGLEKSREIVLYCRSGRRSGMAQESLKKAGYTKVFNGGGYAELRDIVAPGQ